MIDNSNGRKWARFTLALALLMSVAGNVLHTVLTESTVHLSLRIPPAVLWPVFTFLGIEVLVRIVWERSFTHRLARNMVLLPAIPAAIVSYEHLFSLLKLMGERDFIALIGPAAIDGTMIGMTMVLLFTRKLAAQPAPAPAFDYAQPIGPQPAPMPPAVVHIEAIEPLPVPVSPAAPRAPRATRELSWDMRKAAEMAVDGAKAIEITAATGASPATAGRMAKVAKMLRANPAAEIPASEKVRPEGVRIMRELISR